MPTPFFQLWQAITRKYDGKVWQPEERIDRVWALKMWTSWASEYVMKPEKIGTLETGKLADMVVIDRDYLTVPEDDILNPAAGASAWKGLLAGDSATDARIWAVLMFQAWRERWLG